MIGAFLITQNTLCGMLVACYSTFNYLLTDVSLVLSTVIIYLTSNEIILRVSITNLFIGL